MKWLHRLSGVAATLFGAAGIVACLAGIVGVWVVRDRLDNAVAQTVQRVDVALARLERRGQRTNQQIDSIRSATRRLNERVQQGVARLREIPAEDAPDIDEIERQIYAKMQQVKDWIAFMQATVELVEQLLEMIESSSAVLQAGFHTAPDLVASLRAGYEEIERASTLVEEVRRGLAAIHENRDVEETARRMQTLSSRIDTSLQKVERYGAEFAAAIRRTRTSVGELADGIGRRITIGALVGTLLLLWMAAAQLSLGHYGWTSLRGSAPR